MAAAAVAMAARALVAWHHFPERYLSRRPYPMRGIDLQAPRTPEGVEYYGAVRLTILIDAHGRVEDVQPGATTLPPTFVETAAKAFSSVDWEPGRFHGLRVRTLKVVEVDFQPPNRALDGSITPPQ